MTRRYREFVSRYPEVVIFLALFLALAPVGWKILVAYEACKARGGFWSFDSENLGRSCIRSIDPPAPHLEAIDKEADRLRAECGAKGGNYNFATLSCMLPAFKP